MKTKIIVAFILLVIISLGAWLVFSKDVFNLLSPSDLQKIENFNAIQTKIIEYYKINSKLPATLDDLSGLPAKYDYEIQSATNFRLCTDFKADVTQEVIDKAPIRVQYKQGYDCVVFNISGSVLVDPTSTVVIKDAKLLALTNVISATPTDGVTAGSINIKFDTTKSFFYKNDSDGNYLINFYTTIGTTKTCNSALNASTGCCYSLNDISLGSASGTPATFNRLGSADYINPFPVGATDTFGDLPINFCFNGNKEFSGGISFVIPKELISLGAVNKLQFKHINNGETSGVMEIGIN
jgi:hypothetical protein